MNISGPKSSILSIAENFLQLPTAPFREYNIRNFICDFCNGRNIPFKQDDYGNIIISYGKKSTANKNKLAFVAHMDHPGLIVEKNSRDNHCTALFYGGWDPTEFKAAPIMIFSKKGLKICGNAIKWEKSNKKKAWRAFIEVDGPVHTGDIGMWDFKPYRVSGDYLYSRSCDDGIGCVLLLAILDHFLTNKDQSAFTLLFTSAEEAGLHGAKFICANKLLAKGLIPISLETSRELPSAKIGDGVIIRVGDSRSIFTPDITDTIVQIARKIKSHNESFLYQRKLMDGGQCEASVFYSFGYKTGALCIPLGNYHNRNFHKKTTESEYVSITDMINAFSLIKKMIEHSYLFSKNKIPIPEFTERKDSLGQRFLEETESNP